MLNLVNFVLQCLEQIIGPFLNSYCKFVILHSGNSKTTKLFDSAKCEVTNWQFAHNVMAVMLVELS